MPQGLCVRSVNAVSSTCRVLLLFVLHGNAFVSFAGLKQLLKQGSVQKVYNGLQGY